jgi:hypothetical protein
MYLSALLACWTASAQLLGTGIDTRGCDADASDASDANTVVLSSACLSGFPEDEAIHTRRHVSETCREAIDLLPRPHRRKAVNEAGLRFCTISGEGSRSVMAFEWHRICNLFDSFLRVQQTWLSPCQTALKFSILRVLLRRERFETTFQTDDVFANLCV